MTLLSNKEIARSVALALATAIAPHDNARVLAERVRAYCTATLQDPRVIYGANPISGMQEILDGITSGRTWPTDLGSATHRTTELWYRWDAITHMTLHYVLGKCPGRN